MRVEEKPRMRNSTLVAGAFVILSTFASTTARAADDDAPVRTEESSGKPGLVVTGAILSAFGVGHVALAGLAFSSAASCSSGAWCFKDLDNAIGGVSLAIGGALLGVAIPLIVYGSTAKRSTASVAFSPNGVLLRGTF